MFTGIIEEIGRVKGIRRSSDKIFLEIEAEKVLKDIKTGDSIAVNGTCLTAVKMGRKSFSADVMSETFKLTNLSGLSVGDQVNLERAMKLSDRINGHFVSGHVDAQGKVRSVFKQSGSIELTVSIPSQVRQYIVLKGSICLDGVSLTVSKVSKTDFTVSLIPHTVSNSKFKDVMAGDMLNIEADMLAKYVENASGRKEGTVLTDRIKRYDIGSMLDMNGGPSVCN